MVDLLQIVRNLVEDLPFFYRFLSYLSYVIGVVLGIVALRALARRSEMGPNGGSWGSPVATLIIASIFVSIPAFWQALTATFFGDGTAVPDAAAIFGYAPATLGMFEEGSPGRQLITGIVAIVQFIGLIAVIRGLLMLNKAAQGGGGGQSTFGPGVTFVIAGIMAINFPIFVGVFESLLTEAP